ncbi:tRNA dihydrouridine synthase DusB [Methylovirgula ligni]|uniref:tRNA-dihydrouridine synthase n=2 Tax=Methylovirgula ligni TaxID=569860 RepID=A0A3D9YKU5_9HYPH|nr:tRNA dihydrouridine synthase DusB [Methylovirgula ligni]QAY96753.1 tRNA dihydrouridine synthase DusB [Methylovirgula ligni]REF83200.1 tRNA-U20-dihydrouridine synthase [Methylovirgula ligni]
MIQSDQIVGKSTSDFAVGSLQLSGRAFLAPMAGVTDLGMRRAAERLGAALTVTEMLDADFYLDRDPAAALRAEGTGIAHHVVQIAGCRPETMAESARRAEAAGAAMIDINMGCPAKRVTGGFAGSALMRDLDLAAGLIRAVVRAVKVPVSVKMRLGWDADSLNAPELARRAEAEGVAMLTVHGRSRCQFYQGDADWTAIRQVKQATALPVVANGDCKSLEDADDMLRLSGADAVMIGRAAVGRPWFVGEVARHLAGLPQSAPLDAATRCAVALEHYRTLLELMGAAQGLRHARKHLAAYAAYVQSPDSAGLRRRLVVSENSAEVESLLVSLFESEERAVAA